MEEEETLIAELKKIELRKKEREKKTQDLQKLITAADSNFDSRRSEKKQTKKKIHTPHQKINPTIVSLRLIFCIPNIYIHILPVYSSITGNIIKGTYNSLSTFSPPLYVQSISCLFQSTPEPSGIKFADFKTSGVSLRSQRVRICFI